MYREKAFKLSYFQYIYREHACMLGVTKWETNGEQWPINSARKLVVSLSSVGEYLVPPSQNTQNGSAESHIECFSFYVSYYIVIYMIFYIICFVD